MLRYLAPVALLGGLYAYAGQEAGYARTVGASPDAVAASLTDLDMTDAPGAPGSDPARSGGLRSQFVLTREGDDMVWTVTNGGEVAVRLIAHLQPVADGKTKITLDYERGSAPDDRVAPAFRSRAVSLGLFAMVVEDELDRLVMPPTRSREECAEIAESMLARGSMAAPPRALGEAVAQTAKTAMVLGQAEKDLKAMGCPVGFSKDFAPVSNVMGEAPMEAPTQPGISYEPGKPMVDVRPR